MTKSYFYYLGSIIFILLGLSVIEQLTLTNLAIAVGPFVAGVLLWKKAFEVGSDPSSKETL